MTKIQGNFHPLQHLEWLRACKELKPAARDELYYIRTLDPHSDGKKLSVSAIASDLGRDKGTVSRALQVLSAKGFIQFPSCEQTNTEQKIRDCLKSRLGGLSEVKTSVGRIDLLTETEIIEVKRVSDWKSALGQILAYSSFYPEHQKRLHSFGNAKEEKQIADITAACLPFGVMVSVEVVEAKS